MSILARTIKYPLLQSIVALIFSSFLLACGGGEETIEPLLEENTLTIEVNGVGIIQGGNASISCTSVCSSSLQKDVTVQLSATPSSGYVFKQWTGACSGAGNCAVVMSSDRTVAASFELEEAPIQEFDLTITRLGSGSVVSTNEGIDCGIDCAERYLEGTFVTLQALPDFGYLFDGWTGACSGVGNCTIEMNSDREVTASFIENTSTENFTLDVVVSGSGLVSSSPSGISCGNDCTHEYQTGTAVNLTATPNSGYVFDGWSGACTGNTSCNLILDANLTVNANFSQQNAQIYDLDTSVTGQGTVLSTPAGIDCGSDCSEGYTENTQVTLQAIASEGFTFESWSGVCSGSNECVVLMDTAKSVTAIFAETSNNYTLTVAVNGSGRVTSSPNGIDCQVDCTETYQQDTSVTLTAIPESGFVLDHWEGGCSGNGVCTVNMTSDVLVTAVFSVSSSPSVLVENYSPQGDAFQLGDIPNNASGITWHQELQQYLVVRNNSAVIYRYDVNFAYMGLISVNGINTDTEGLAYVGTNEVMIVSEDNFASKIEIDEFTTMINGDVPASQRYRVMTRGASNKGMEGVAVRKASGSQLARVYACQEGTQGSGMRVVYFDIEQPDPLILLDYASNLTVVEPFDADQAFAGSARDLAGMLYDPRTGHLLIVSQESRVLLQVNPDTGSIISELDLTGAPQFEGVTLGPNNELVFVSEGNWIRIYEQN